MLDRKSVPVQRIRMPAGSHAQESLMKSEQAKTVKAQNTRKTILATALKLFREKGFEQTTMREIAAQASVALGAAYYYFSSKEKIVFAFYKRTQDEMQAALPASLSGITDFKGRLRAAMTLKIRLLKPYHRFLGALFLNAADPNSAISPFGKATTDIRVASTALFQEVIEGSDFRP